MKKVLIAAPVHAVLLEGLAAMGYECVQQTNITQKESVQLLPGCAGVITSTRLNLNEALLSQAPNLQWIGRMGSGMEVIDTVYAQKKGIYCFSSPEGNSNAVAEHTLGMLLMLIRHINTGHAQIQGGIWEREGNRGIELEGKTMAIIGFGYTGRALAHKLSVFDMKLLAFDTGTLSDIPPYVTLCHDMNAIFEEADIVSLHVPLIPANVAMITPAWFNKFHKKIIFINTSRGQIASTATLHHALATGQIVGACLDVHAYEPPHTAPLNEQNLQHAIAAMPNVITTPHIAGYTHEALYKMSAVLLQKLRQWTTKNL